MALTFKLAPLPHLERYLDEQTFRFNGRKLNDCERFEKAVGGTLGHRLMYKDLIGETANPA